MRSQVPEGQGLARAWHRAWSSIYGANHEQTLTIVRGNVRLKGSMKISFMLQLRTIMVKVKGRVEFTKFELGFNGLLRLRLE